MTWLVIDAIILMFVCFALGALMAWLLSVALYPKASEVPVVGSGLSGRGERAARRRESREKRLRSNA